VTTSTNDISLATERLTADEPHARSTTKEQRMSRIVVITGASAGIGRATARAFAAEGWDVGLLARGETGLDAAAEEVRGAGGRALAIPLDVADPDAVEAAAARIERELGPIEVWVNDAMESVFAPADEIRPDEYRRVTEVNYLGYVHGTLAALRRMKQRDRGVIVQVGSALAYRSIPLQAAYCASKHAIVGFTDSLRCELSHDRSHVRMTAVHMPAVNTPQFSWVRSRLPNRAQPVPPIFEPEVAARAILHAAHHPSRELFVGFPTLLAVWGQKFVPGILDWYLGRTGYASQQTPEARPERPDNLDAPLDAVEDRGARGRFEARSRSWSPALELAIHGRLVAAAAALVALATVALRSRLGREGH
jgi:NAD(P)-dependent dehydrogenase (short-subunit alcohol dehydrogenase family)